MTPDTFVELHGATCLHCGHRTAAAMCPRCSRDTSMAGPVLVRPDAVRVGYIGRGGTATHALWLRAPVGAVRPSEQQAATTEGAADAVSSPEVILADPTNPSGVDITGPTPTELRAPAPGSLVDTIVTASGRTVDVQADGPNGFVPVGGLTDIRCGVAAALIA